PKSNIVVFRATATSSTVDTSITPQAEVATISRPATTSDRGSRQSGSTGWKKHDGRVKQDAPGRRELTTTNHDPPEFPGAQVRTCGRSFFPCGLTGPQARRGPDQAAREAFLQPRRRRVPLRQLGCTLSTGPVRGPPAAPGVPCAGQRASHAST